MKVHIITEGDHELAEHRHKSEHDLPHRQPVHGVVGEPVLEPRVAGSEGGVFVVSISPHFRNY